LIKADLLFKKDLEEINNQEWEVDNRAIWEDGTQVKTKRILQVTNKYDLAKEFPILTLRPIYLKGAIDEMLWVYQKRSNNIKDLNSKVWNKWADEKGEIGRSYGYQIDKPMMGYPSQLDYVLGEGKKNPTSRRLYMNMFHTDDSPHKALFECAYATHFTIKDNKLHSTLIQRSGDFLTAAGSGGWNTVSYAILTHMIARHLELEVGTFTHFVQDLHLYNKHQQFVNVLLTRESKQAPKLTINPDVKNFYDFTVDDFKLEGYEPHPQIKGIEVAV
jgi:thymidylate synthase